MKEISYNHFLYNGITIFEMTECDENGVTVSQSHEPFVEAQQNEEDEVTHNVFFGENIRRVRKVLFPKSRTKN